MIKVYVEEIIPLMERFGIIKEISNSSTHQSGSRAWVLKEYDLSSIIEVEEDPTSPRYKLWKEVNTQGKVR